MTVYSKYQDTYLVYTVMQAAPMQWMLMWGKILYVQVTQLF